MALPPLVLIVDDDVNIATMLSEHLQRQGMRVTHCHDAAQAMIQAEALRPALVIADIMMPAFGSGIDAYKKMRLHPRLKEVPVIFLTGLKPAQAKPLMPPGDAKVRLLHKPVTLAELMQTIRDLTGDRLLPASPGKGSPHG